MSKIAPTRKSQKDRSAEMKKRLIQSAISSLVDKGFAATTVVEICKRAEVSRGAFFHHYEGLPDLFEDSFTSFFDDIMQQDQPQEETPADFVERAWKITSQTEYKALIEIWLAARNDEKLGEQLRPVIARVATLFDPALNDKVGASRINAGEDTLAYYRLIAEAMIGMAFGRATTPGSTDMGHERLVVNLLKKLVTDKAKLEK